MMMPSSTTYTAVKVLNFQQENTAGRVIISHRKKSQIIINYYQIRGVKKTLKQLECLPSQKYSIRLLMDQKRNKTKQNEIKQ